MVVLLRSFHNVANDALNTENTAKDPMPESFKPTCICSYLDEALVYWVTWFNVACSSKFMCPRKEEMIKPRGKSDFGICVKETVE